MQPERENVMPKTTKKTSEKEPDEAAHPTRKWWQGRRCGALADSQISNTCCSTSRSPPASGYAGLDAFATVLPITSFYYADGNANLDAKATAAVTDPCLTICFAKSNCHRRVYGHRGC